MMLFIMCGDFLKYDLVYLVLQTQEIHGLQMNIQEKEGLDNLCGT